MADSIVSQIQNSQNYVVNHRLEELIDETYSQLHIPNPLTKSQQDETPLDRPVSQNDLLPNDPSLSVVQQPMPVAKKITSSVIDNPNPRPSLLERHQRATQS